MNTTLSTRSVSHRTVLALVTGCGLLLAGFRPACAAEARPDGIVSITRLNEHGGRVAWDHSGSNRIAYDRREADGYFDVFTMDEAGRETGTLTSGRPGLPTKHNGNPSWHPGGEMLVMQMQRMDIPAGDDDFAVPGAGVLNEVWFARADGSRFWRLDSAAPPSYVRPAGVLHPHFDHQGNRLVWSELVGLQGGAFGEWRLKLADFALVAGEPVVTNIRTYNPGNGQAFFEPHSFSADGSRFLYTSGQDVFLEIHAFDIATEQSTRLTFSPLVWDEHAHFSPGGTDILWMSSRDLPTGAVTPTDFWIMDADGSNPRRLSWLNDPSHQHWQRSTFIIASDVDWSADGRRAVAYVQDTNTLATVSSGYNILITFRLAGQRLAPIPADADLIYSARATGETDANGRAPTELYATDLQGRTITRLTHMRHTYNHFAVSPDRRWIAANRIPQDSNGSGGYDPYDWKQLWMLDLEADLPSQLLSDWDVGYGGIDWSPDGDWIYASMVRAGQPIDIRRVHPDGTGLENLTCQLLSALGIPGLPHEKWVSDASVSSDGQSMAFIFAPYEGGSVRNKTQVVVARNDGTLPRLVTDGGPLPPGLRGPWGVGDFDPELSPDGSMVTFQRVTDVGFVGGVSTGDILAADTVTLNINSVSPPRQPAIHGIPDWSDRGLIVFSEWSNQPTNVGPVLANPDGSVVSRLPVAFNGSHFRWIPPAWPTVRLRMERPAPDALQIRFPGTSGFRYQFQEVLGAGPIQDVGADFPGADQEAVIPLSPAGSRGFYRLKVSLDMRRLGP